jgi:high-affinity Fe2+/Pb2+ permease
MSNRLAGLSLMLMVFIMFLGAWYSDKREDKQWNDYSNAHHCRSIGFAGNGDYAPSQVIYQCDTGVKEYAK